MTVDKNYCASSYLAFRYIDKPEMEFAEGIHHLTELPPQGERVLVDTVDELDDALADVFTRLEGQKLGLLLSGGMDSACLASYMRGCDAYTFRFLGGEYQCEETQRAEVIAEAAGMNLHYVDITWDSMQENIDAVIINRGAPVHSIEPQMAQAAIQAKADGIEHLLCGEGADIHFGGLTHVLSRDWDFDDFVADYTYTDPALVWREPYDMTYAFERHRLPGGKIDFLAFMSDVYTTESSQSFVNAFQVAGMPYTGGYNDIFMRNGIDLEKARSGNSKHLIRGLFAKKYEGLVAPEKTPLPRPVDAYFADWAGPVRSEFRDDIDMSKLSGNQKWQLWCLEYFLNMVDDGRFA